MASNQRYSTASRENVLIDAVAEDDADADISSEAPIEWSNLIFLPFQPAFKLIILFSVILKIILGPIQSVYPVVYCWNVMERNNYLLVTKYLYWYCADPLYMIDTFLHIVHRQVTDKAMRREYLPKSAFCILLDFAALIPFYRMTSVGDCPQVELWPNVLAFNEFILIYRVVEYFSLATTHSLWNAVLGLTLLLICTINCITCFWLLLTKHGLCSKCKNSALFDWRSNVYHKLNETDDTFLAYIYGATFIYSYLSNKHLDDTKPLTIIEFIAVCILCVISYILIICIMMPKLFAESILKLRRIATGYPHFRRILKETKRRNASQKTQIKLRNYLKVIWLKRSGIINIPDVISELPRYLRLDIRQDLSWPMFYHSPTLRKRSISFKRFLCDYIVQDFLLPGEKLFTGSHSQASLYYLKSGVMQILSGDEGITPILSLGGGTIIGDISFYVPPFHRKINLVCLTYCTVLVLTRRDYIRALHKYPEDRRQVAKLTRGRLKHAKTLYNCKQNVKGLDRAEDEGISWLKRRWWEISNFLHHWKSKGKINEKCVLPPEETTYHCAKYIGQLVLCTEAQLQTKSLFTNASFPWILVPHSTFIVMWRQIVIITVILVVIIYPPNLIRKEISTSFKFFQIWTELVYITDIGISLLTAVKLSDGLTDNFASVMFARCKTFNFNLDLISTIWIEYFFLAIGKGHLFNLAQYNRLIKMYILFSETYIHSDVRNNPVVTVLLRIILINCYFWYISGYIIYILDLNIKNATTAYFFGNKFCKQLNYKGACDPGSENVLGVFVAWIVECLTFSSLNPLSVADIYIATAFTILSYATFIYSQSIFIASIYLKYRDATNYQNFVSNLKKYYSHYKIHTDLLKRLERYLLCHWKYYQGLDVMYPNIIKTDHYDIYWMVQGEVAEKLIGESEAFRGADRGLIRDIAYATKCMMLPKKSTIYLFSVQCQNVTWIVQGQVKCEYHNEAGELLKDFYGPGHMLSDCSIFLGKASLRTYIASTDCEILYIKVQDFFKIIQRYPDEWSYLNTCITEFRPIFEEMFYGYLKKHRDYQNRLRDRVFHGRRSTPQKRSIENIEKKTFSLVLYDFWTTPNSTFTQLWLPFRMIVVIVSIASASLQGGSGAVIRRGLDLLSAFCDSVAWIDIVLKMFLAYYDERGILIYDKQKCIIHYLTRGFMLDIIGSLPLFEVYKSLVTMQFTDDKGLLINTLCKFSHLYIIFGYFEYVGNMPTINYTYVVIVKWFVVAILTMLVSSHFLMLYCVDLTFDTHNTLIDVEILDTCWLPDMYILDNMTMEGKLHLIYAESLNLAQCGLLTSSFRSFRVNLENISVVFAMLLLIIIFWFVTGYTLTMLVLNSRGNTLFQHGVDQLRNFLKSERVDKELINRAVAHFTYWWIRTKGINIHHLTNERIGMVLRQDLNYFFYKKTYQALDTLLHAGDHVERQLASACTLIFLMPNEEVIREMDITSWVFVVHRGKIIVYENGEEQQTLTKGSIFGQLTGTIPRPVRISARAEGYTDLLQLNIKQFQEIINDNIRIRITCHPQSKNDYMAINKKYKDNPYRSMKYILRGRKTILLPFMNSPVEALKGNNYSRWLYIAWLVQPFLAAVLALSLKAVEPHIRNGIYYALIPVDLIHMANFILEFFTMELVIVNRKCIQRIVGYRTWKRFDFYIDIITVALPSLTYLTGNINYQLIRLLRLKYLYNFQRHFCMSFHSKSSPMVLKFALLFLFIHASTISWITLACKSKEFPSGIRREALPPNASTTIDYTEWVLPEEREGGCTKLHYFPNIGNAYVVPLEWYNDYLIAMSYIVFLFTNTSIHSIATLTLDQIYFKLIITIFIYSIKIWLASVTISFMTTKFRELYQYDYSVQNLLVYLKHSGLSPTLLESVKIYTKQLWRRQRGTWLPELAQSAPLCLRQDMFCALYMHHLESIPMLRELPLYFRRQLVTKLKRIVVFPGKCIVQEGDIFPCIYFIHEGEVEKYSNDKNGDTKFVSLLTTNGYFGSLAGLFPNIPFQFSYYSRTVVDIVHLRLVDWQDLLDGYPDLKCSLYTSAQIFKDAELLKH